MIEAEAAWAGMSMAQPAATNRRLVTTFGRAAMALETQTGAIAPPLA
jgi:hypothetical protein